VPGHVPGRAQARGNASRALVCCPSGVFRRRQASINKCTPVTETLVAAAEKTRELYRDRLAL